MSLKSLGYQRTSRKLEDTTNLRSFAYAGFVEGDSNQKASRGIRLLARGSTRIALMHWHMSSTSMEYPRLLQVRTSLFFHILWQVKASITYKNIAGESASSRMQWTPSTGSNTIPNDGNIQPDFGSNNDIGTYFLIRTEVVQIECSLLMTIFLLN